MTDIPPTQPTLSREVFISYASQDKTVADAVCEALERAGVACWIAPRDVAPGKFYAESIVHAIDSAKVIVLVLSQNGSASQHVVREVERASSKRHPVVSLRLDTAPLPAGLEYFLNTSQWMDASAIGVDRALPRLVDAVKSALAQPSAAARVNPSPPATTKMGQRRSRIFVALAVVIAVALAALYAPKLWLAKHGPTEQPTTATTTAISDKSIAVLPFTDMSEKHDQEYFGDGMAEEILDLLTKIPGLTVIGRTSSFQFKGKNADLRTIGTQLNAAYVLEGSVRKSGSLVRITAQLINTRTGAHEWSETYDRPIGDVLKLQDAIAATVVRELQLTVAPDYLSPRSTVKNVGAYDLMLRGRHALDRGDKEGWDEAATLFQQALDRDPTSADAAAALAQTYWAQALLGFLPPAAGFEQARRAVTNTLKLDPKNVHAHYVLGMIHVEYDWDWAAAGREFQQATILGAGSVDVLRGEAALSLTLGRWDDALRQTKAALAQDPLNIFALQDLSWIQECRGRLPEAEAAARRVLDIRPTSAYGHSNLGHVLLERGDRDAALIEMQQETTDDGKQQGLAIVYYALGRTADSDAALAGMLKDQADGNALGIAEVYAFRGKTDEAMHWLEHAYSQKEPYLFTIKSDKLLKNLESDPRYKAFLRKMNLPE
jgi:adenylate cyclase